MKKNLFVAGLAVLAMAVSACDENGNSLLPKAEIDLNSSSTVHSEDLLALQNPSVKADSKGVYYVEETAGTTLSGSFTSVDKDKKINGTLAINASSLPEAASPVTGGLSESAVLLTVDNPSKTPIFIKGSSEAAGKKFQLPEAQIASKPTTVVAYSTAASPEAIPTLSNPDVIVALPNEGKVLDKGPGNITVSDLTISTVSSKSVQTAAGYEVKIAAKYVAPLMYALGSTIHLDRHFSDLNISLDRVTYSCSEYDISMEVVNTLPFDIMLSVSSAEGVSGALKSPIKAGTLENPVTTSVVLNVKDSSGKQVSNITSADLAVDLTAAAGATLKKGQTFTLNLDKFTVIKIF
ncbi:MAG: hypothetical protein IK031_06370 [Bacteroidales bacterium]|nr:hypothetical protein [Bacteroidales bacterium]